MPTITINLAQMEKAGIEKASIKTLLDKLGMSLEKAEGSDLTIEITPNRPDLLEVNGIIRALRSISAKDVPKEKHYSINNKPALKILVGRGVKRTRPHIAALVVKNADLSGIRLKELINFMEKFCDTYGRKRNRIAIGMHSLKKISGDILYDAAKTGKLVPLGSTKEASFNDVLKSDKRGLEFGEIVERYGTFPFLKDSEKVIALIPIVNSETTRVTESTKDLFIDITGTSKSAVDDSANLIASIFIDMKSDVYPCEICLSGKAPELTPKMEYKEIAIRRLKLEHALGIAIEERKIIEMGNRMGHIASQYGKKILFYVPPYRTDVISERDIIEDVAIAYGYEKINPTPIYSSSVGIMDQVTEDQAIISRIMTQFGFTEAINTYLTNEKQNFEKMELPETDDMIKVAYAKTETLSILRKSILPSLLGNLSTSAQANMPQRLFEIGSVFSMVDEKPKESISLSLVSEHSRSNFSEIKSYIMGLLSAIGIKSASVSEELNPSFIGGRCAAVNVGGTKIGIIGEINPKVLNNFRLEEPVAAAELDVTSLLSKI